VAVSSATPEKPTALIKLLPETVPVPIFMSMHVARESIVRIQLNRTL
jgi:hypothetical protein